MPIPSYAETLGASLGPDITIITNGEMFQEGDEDTKTLDISTMNAELSKFSDGDDIVFERSGPPKKDIPFQTFLEEQRSLTHH